ncbi:MAG: hypothetical protein R2822_28280 [Spirosomataceae bacterium]
MKKRDGRCISPDLNIIDNAAMDLAAHSLYLEGDFCAQTVSPMPRMEF